MTTPLSICVLGGTGFIGSAMVPRLVADGHRVKLLTRNRARHRELLVLPTLTLVQTDVYDDDALVLEFAGCDVVINLVGILNERGFRGSGFRRAHTELARRVVAACRTSGVRRYLHMSSLKADAERGPSHYLRSKGAAEDVLRSECGADLDYVIFQPSVVFGAGDGFINRFAGLLKAVPGVFPLACASAKFAPVYVGDVTAAFAACLRRPDAAGRTFQLCGPQIVTLAEVVRTIAASMRLRRWVLPLPRPLSWLQGALMNFVPGRPFSTDNYRSATVDSVCDCDGLGELGIARTSLIAIVPRLLRRR